MTSTSITFGNYEEFPDHQEFLRLAFSSAYLSLQNHWLHNSLTASFLAEYWSTFLISRPFPARYPLGNFKEIISYVANELLDNAVKYGFPAPHSTPQVLILITPAAEYLRFYVTNSSNPENWGPFQEYIHRLLTEDPEILYFRQMEANAASQEQSVSRLGLLSIVHDYQGQVAWKFTVSQQASEASTVTTMVQLPIFYQEY